MEDYRKNPLWTKAGRKEIKKIIAETGVSIDFICADYFMRNPFHKNIKQKEALSKILKSLVEFAKEINASVVEIPLLDNSSMSSEKDEEAFRRIIMPIMPHAEKHAISISLETDLDPKRFKNFMKKLRHPLIKITYDSGNSSGIGYDPREEFKAYSKHMKNIHIKDRLKGGTTMPLGTGSADLSAVFEMINKHGRIGSIVLQAARGKDGDEFREIKSQITFVERLIKKYSP